MTDASNTAQLHGCIQLFAGEPGTGTEVFLGIGAGLHGLVTCTAVVTGQTAHGETAPLSCLQHGPCSAGNSGGSRSKPC